MPLKERLDQDLKIALKSKQTNWISTIRLVKAAIINREIAVRRPLTDPELLEVVASQLKMRREALEHFRRANRDDLIEKEEAEASFLEKYLPQPLSTDEIEEEISKAIAEAVAQGPKDFGRVMKLLMPRLVGRADNRVVSEMARQRLSDL